MNELEDRMKILIQEAITEASEENALLTVRMESLETKFAEIEVNMERKKKEKLKTPAGLSVSNFGNGSNKYIIQIRTMLQIFN